jgi:hypothetical protein
MHNQVLGMLNKEVLLKINWPLVIIFVLFWSYGLYGSMTSGHLIFQLGFAIYLIGVALYFLFIGIRKKDIFTLSYVIQVKDIFVFVTMILIWFYLTFDRLIEPITGDQFFYTQISKLYEFYFIYLLSKFVDLNNIVYREAIYWIDLLILVSVFIIIYVKRLIKFSFISIGVLVCSTIILTRLIMLFMGGERSAHPPFQLFPIWMTTSMFGLSDFSLRSAQLFGLISCSFIMYLTFIKEFGRLNAFFIATTLCSIPLLIHVATQVEGSIWSSILFIILLIHIFSMDEQKFIFWFGFAAIISIAVLMRITSFIVIPVFLILFIRHNWGLFKEDKIKILYALSPFLICLPFILNSIFGGTPALDKSQSLIPVNYFWYALSNGIIFKVIFSVFSVGWFLLLIGIFIKHNHEKHYWLNRILILIFLLTCLFMFFSIRPVLWSFDKYKAEYIVPLMVLGGYLFFSKIQLFPNRRIIIPILSCCILFFGVTGFKVYPVNIIDRADGDFYERKSEEIYDYKSALIAAKEAGLAKYTLFAGTTYGMYPQILSGYSISEVLESFELCKGGIGCGLSLLNSTTAHSQLINNNPGIKLVLISDGHSELRYELLQLGWADWNQFYSKNKNIVYGMVRN